MQDVPKSRHLADKAGAGNFVFQLFLYIFLVLIQHRIKSHEAEFDPEKSRLNKSIDFTLEVCRPEEETIYEDRGI